ncbi:MAG: S1C family serine protease [Candidatus Izemoplasmatales bacterium]
MKKKIMLVLLFVSFFYLSGCSLLTMTLNIGNTDASTTLPSTIDGTISIGDLEYSTFPTYHSETYDLTNIDEYNDVLLNTRDMIRHSNIQITTTLYNYVQKFPWSTLTELTLAGGSEGSGVIFMEDDTYYYALTNYHVVDGEADERVYQIQAFEDSEPSEATLVTYDTNYDLAVLKFEKQGRTQVHIIDYTTRLFTQFTPGELVFAVGNPLDVNNNVTFGEFKSMQTLSNVSFSVIYHDAPIHEGSSGGALVDVDGNLLGLNTWGYEDDDEYSFSVPNYIIYTFLINNGVI